MDSPAAETRAMRRDIGDLKNMMAEFFTSMKTQFAVTATAAPHTHKPTVQLTEAVTPPAPDPTLPGVDICADAANQREQCTAPADAATLETPTSDTDAEARRLTGEWVRNATNHSSIPLVDTMAAAFIRAMKDGDSTGTLRTQPQEEDPKITSFMARQTGARDLPQFNGDPLDWRIFKARFAQSTNVCKLSNAENALRLQRALTGRAKEAVSDMLVDPDNVPEIMEMLEKNFGHPEVVIDKLIQRVRKIPRLTDSATEAAVTDYAILIRNVVSTIEGYDSSHLAAPKLLTEMVSKLPMNLRWMWIMSRADDERNGTGTSEVREETAEAGRTRIQRDRKGNKRKMRVM
jgi:hypothetical protein